MKFIFAALGIVFIGLLFFYCSRSVKVDRTHDLQNQSWRFEVVKAKPLLEGSIGEDLGIKFISSNGRVVQPKFRQPYRICFMKFFCDSGDGKYRRFTMDFADGIKDYREYLVDMKGDGDCRHLIVCNYEGGNSAAQYQAFLIDTKDGFKILKEIPAGESPDYPKHNPDLIFK